MFSSAIHMFPSRRSVSVHSRLAPRGKRSPCLEFERRSRGFSFFFFSPFFVVVEPCSLPSPLLLLLLLLLSSPPPPPPDSRAPGAEATQRSLSPSVHWRQKGDTRGARAKLLFYRACSGQAVLPAVTPLQPSRAARGRISATLHCKAGEGVDCGRR